MFFTQRGPGQGRSQDFSKGGGTLCQQILSWRFRHGILLVVCLTKGLQRGGGWLLAPEDSSYALADDHACVGYKIMKKR